MNYRHAFHAGNFADLLKHALLLEVMARLEGASPLCVIDTHAGAGLYALDSPEARRTGEAEAGIVRLMADAAAPAEFAPLKRAVGRLNRSGPISRYPGSPLLIAGRLGPRDRLIACEAEPGAHAALRQTLTPFRGAEAVRGDGWRLGLQRSPKAPARLLVLIDPPFEAANDADEVAGLTRSLLRVNPAAVIVVWAPLKDLASLYALFAALEAAAGRHEAMTVEMRLRPPLDPLRFNGCALVVINPPDGVDQAVRPTGDWIARTCGEGGEVRIQRRAKA